MPSLKIYNVKNATLDRQIDYEFGDESLSDILAEYEKKIGINSDCWNVSFGGVRFLDMNLPLISCLEYGDSMIVSLKKTKQSSLNFQLKVTVKTLTGKSIVFEAESCDTVESIKMKIKDREGIRLHQQRLFWNGRHLVDGTHLSDYDICEKNVTFLLVLSLPGGGCSVAFANVKENGN